MSDKRWTSVKRKLPEVEEDVLAWVIYEDGNEHVTDTWLDSDGTWAMGSAKNFKVTHWMPLPKAPRSRP